MFSYISLMPCFIAFESTLNYPRLVLTLISHHLFFAMSSRCQERWTYILQSSLPILDNHFPNPPFLHFPPSHLNQTQFTFPLILFFVFLYSSRSSQSRVVRAIAESEGDSIGCFLGGQVGKFNFGVIASILRTHTLN